MNKYTVISDSACDLPLSTRKQYQIDVVPFKMSFDKKNKLTDGVDISIDELFDRLEASSALPKTYFPTVEDYVKHFKEPLEQGQDILCLCLSSKLSKSYVSAQNAKKILSYIYPKNKIMVLDTLMASAGQALMVLDAVKLSSTYDVLAAYAKLEEIRKGAFSIFTVESLNQLARGGRMSATTAALGKLLKINPIIYLCGGVLQSRGKAFGRSNALKMIGELTIQEMGGKPEAYDFAMLHSRSRQEAIAVAGELQTRYGLNQTIPPIDLGATIGMHTGASVVATAFVKKV